MNSLHEMQELGVSFVSITEALDFTTSLGRAMAGMLAIFANFERDILRERVKAGIQNARNRGVKHGRPGTALALSNDVKNLHAQGKNILKLQKY